MKTNMKMKMKMKIQGLLPVVVAVDVDVVADMSGLGFLHSYNHIEKEDPMDVYSTMLMMMMMKKKKKKGSHYLRSQQELGVFSS